MAEKKTYKNRNVSFWTFDYSLQNQGLVLENVFHDEYHYANDLRTVMLYLEYEKSTYSEVTGKATTELILIPVRLSSDYFDTVSQVELFEDIKDRTFDPLTASLGSFKKYPFSIGLKVAYTRNTKILENADFDKLSVVQSYLFCRYSKTPAHEPGGILPAARFFPLIKFEFARNKQYKKSNKENPVAYRLLSVRADCRFHLSLDMFLNYEGKSYMDKSLGLSKVSKEEEDKLKKEKPNQAALVRDKESVPLGTDLDELFASIEKPLLKESCAMGLFKSRSWDPKLTTISGGPRAPASQVHRSMYPTWDNIHWWGLMPGKKMLPSTPGAFHASHIHWRWAKIAGNPSALDLAIITSGNFVKTGKISPGAAGEDQFKGLDLGDGGRNAFESSPDIGGPLLDVNIPIQTYRLAILKASRFPADSETKENYFESFTSRKAEDISSGGDILLNLSVQAFNNITTSNSIFGGTFFIHGFYFAHDHDPTISDRTSPFYETIGKGLNNGYRSESQWFISPKDSINFFR